jgi:ABC-2 type transport system permease protein
MRTLKYLLKKEFKQIFRNKAILAMIIAMPIMQLLILPLAADYEIKNIKLVVVDNDHSGMSKEIVNTIIASGYFKLVDYNQSYKRSLDYIKADEADLILEIPVNFERNLIRENGQKLFIAVNAINGTKANLGGSYLTRIIGEYNKELLNKIKVSSTNTPIGEIDVSGINWFNPRMNYRSFMVPGILAILVTMVGGFLTALNIVKEKEVGTIEQINVTPIRKHHFILGKLLPFWILGNVVFTLGMAVAWLVYGIVPNGSLITIYVFIWVYLLAVMGFGLLISTYSETQQQAMLVMFFFMMVFILMGGLFTSIDSMPGWAKVIARLNPVTYIVEVFRMVILKGSSLKDIMSHITVIASFAVILNIWAVKNYRKTV